MSNGNVQNLLIFLVLVSLFKNIRSDWDYDIDQQEFPSRPPFENNIPETISEMETTTDFTVDDEKFDDNELKKLFLRNFRLFESIESDRYNVEMSERGPRRRYRDVGNVGNTTINTNGMECYSCLGNGTSKSDINCYQGLSMQSKKCADAEHCFIEFNPLYIKRGCMLRGRVNRTFICKCPLCNDKPSFDSSYYEYRTLSDWEYDNARLQTPLVGMDLMCKVCETKGTNPTSDKNCRFGKNADYMVCGRNQLCYTNIDDETDFVSRGCIDKPLYNSIYFFCNQTLCNSDQLYNPKDKLKLRVESTDPRAKKKHRKQKRRNFSNKNEITDFYLPIIIVFMKFI